MSVGRRTDDWKASFEDSAADNGKILDARSIYTERGGSPPCQQQWGDPSDRESVLAFGKYLKGKKERERLMRESEGN